jgi:hypothetical protein
MDIPALCDEVTTGFGLIKAFQIGIFLRYSFRLWVLQSGRRAVSKGYPSQPRKTPHP